MFGFKCSFSKQNALMIFLENVFSKTNNYYFILMNLYKTFTLSKKDILYENLHTWGFEGRAFQLIQAFVQKTVLETVADSDSINVSPGKCAQTFTSPCLGQ